MYMLYNVRIYVCAYIRTYIVYLYVYIHHIHIIYACVCVCTHVYMYIHNTLSVANIRTPIN